MAEAAPRPLTATHEIPADPDRVWAVVSDVRRTPEWSPECRRVLPLVAPGRPVREGTLLVGLNRRGRVHWATLSRVTDVDPSRRIAWVVLTNRSEWAWEVTDTPDGTRVVQTRRTPRGESRFALWFTRRLLGGQGGHDDELERGMHAGLLRVADLVA